jgi:hypothetical protein
LRLCAQASSSLNSERKPHPGENRCSSSSTGQQRLKRALQLRPLREADYGPAVKARRSSVQLVTANWSQRLFPAFAA